MASSAFEHNRARCLEAGADDFLPKPFRHGRLLELLSTELGLTLVYADASADEGVHRKRYRPEREIRIGVGEIARALLFDEEALARQISMINLTMP